MDELVDRKEEKTVTIAYNNAVFAYRDMRTDGSCFDNGPFAYRNVVADLERIVAEDPIRGDETGMPRY